MVVHDSAADKEPESQPRDEPRSDHGDCFRLVHLKEEVQNVQEVTKPILDELEVMRLSCSLGVLSSVNPKDFEFKLLEAREFDGDFARFLRKEVFPQQTSRTPPLGAQDTNDDSSKQIRVMSLFGKQAEIKQELIRWGCWSDNCEKKLLPNQQGIFCVHRSHSNNEVPEPQSVLMVFSWLQDVLFESEHLRDTATYVLRFLTSLSPDITCTLSREDVQRIEEIATKLSVSQFDEWKSYSVAFRVEKQQDERDEVRVKHVKTIVLPELPDGHNRFLVKGSYPAVAVLRLAPATIRTRTSRVNFTDFGQLCHRLVAQAKTHKTKLLFNEQLGVQHHEQLLSAAGQMPIEKLCAIKGASAFKTKNIEAKCKEEVELRFEAYRGRLIQAASAIFNVDISLKSGSAKRAIDSVKSCIGELREEFTLWEQVEEETKTVLNMPMRLWNQMPDIHDFLSSHPDEEELQRNFENIMYKKGKTFGKEPEGEPISKKVSNAMSRIGAFAGNLFSGKQERAVEFPAAFREEMEVPLARMKNVWWQAVEIIFGVYHSHLVRQEVEKQMLQLTFDDEQDRLEAIRGAFDELLNNWYHDCNLSLSAVITARSRHGTIYCTIEEENLDPPCEQLEVQRINTAKTSSHGNYGDIRSLGIAALQTNEKVLSVYSVQQQALLIVTASPSGTHFHRVKFPPQDYRLVPPTSKPVEIRTFGKIATSCDFDFAQRTIALVHGAGSVVLYKFNETFTSMETTRSIDLGVRTTLSLPLQDLLLLDNAIVLRDHTMACQAVNLRSQQTSRKTELVSPSNCVWNSAMFPLADGLALGCFIVNGNGDTSSAYKEIVCSGQVVAISSDDHRQIPVCMDSDVTILSQEGISVQCVGDMLLVLDPVTQQVQALRTDTTIRSDSYKIQHSRDIDANYNNEEESREEEKLEHWLWSFYHVYEKFPVQGMIYGHMTSSLMERAVKVSIACPASAPAMFESFCKQYFQSIMNHLHKLNKPLGVMDLARDMSIVQIGTGDQSFPNEYKTIRARRVSSFLQDLITFIPIQICRAEGNTLTVMVDGQDRSGIETHINQAKQLQTFDIALSIRFGLLTPILESWRGRCVVITSMGKQSTGKSYFLNHLTGSSFAIAGARCTDGAWMTLRVLRHDVMLIVLDFEGLGSFERTEQEDVFLSVLNAAISMFTIFRMEMRLDKEIDDIFSKFQKGIQLIKNDPKLFRGKLYMSIKDVNPNDQRGVVGEFVTKFQKLLGENKDHNFLSDMYSGQLDINCSPPLGTSGYYQSLAHSQQYIEHRLCNDPDMGFPSGRSFLDCIRLLLAKISILDWTSLDESNQKMQLAEIQSRLPGLIRTGALIPIEHASDAGYIQDFLKEDIEMDRRAIEICLEQMAAEFPSFAEKWLVLDSAIQLDTLRDQDIDLGFDICKFDEASVARAGTCFLSLFGKYLEVSGTSANEKLDRQMQASFDVFLSYCVSRRKWRILTWVKSILGDRLPEEWKAMELQYLGRFQLILKRCPQKCDSCQLGCMQSGVHSAMPHDCGLGHACKGRCEYCEATGQPGKTPLCSKQAGHEGMCECEYGDHTCGEACCLSSAPNCGKRCSEKIGHEGSHQCSVKIHKCGEPCCAKDCHGRCILSIEQPHTAHKCEEVRCIEKCLMEGCTELCGAMDHFHGQTDIAVAYSLENPSEKTGEVFDAESQVPATHMCSKSHVCPANCSEKGNCYVEVFHKESTKTFSGARGTFQYKFQEMNGFRKKCSQMLLPGQQTHHGAHSCIHDDEDQGNEETAAARTIHYCEYRCPCCSYFCRKEYGHFGMHATSHGNMRNTYFLADMEDIDLDERKYKVGELGIAEMCNLYCSKMGREHVHYLNCEQESAETCVHGGDPKDQRRHCTRKLEPKPEHGVDEALHDEFWKTLGWEDPCTSAHERAEFGKCSYKCDAPSHDEQASYCVLPAWHKPETKPSDDTTNEFSYIRGHKFKCSHVTETPNMHHVFVLDCSGSMEGHAWAGLMAAWRAYMHNRVAQGALADLISVVTFNDEAKIEYEAQSISSMLRAGVHFRNGRTSYGAGLRAANEVISRNDFVKFKPILVFFSDGYPCDNNFTDLARHIEQSYAKYDFKMFAVGFGNADLEMLEYVAGIMGGEFRTALTGNELKNAFYSISTSLSSRVGLALSKPSHECLCPICQRDLASEDLVQLKPCHHEMHTECWRQLAAQPSGGVKPLCPMCRKEVSV